MNKMSFAKLCRSCMKEADFNNFEECVLEMFTFCTNIQVSEDNNLPKHFCYQCIYQIKSSYKYIKQAHNINKALKILLYENAEIKLNHDLIKFDVKSEKYCENTSVGVVGDLDLKSSHIDHLNKYDIEDTILCIDLKSKNESNLNNEETKKETQCNQVNEFLRDMTQGLISDLNDNVEEFVNVSETQTTELKQIQESIFEYGTFKEDTLTLDDNKTETNESLVNLRNTRKVKKKYVDQGKDTDTNTVKNICSICQKIFAPTNKGATWLKRHIIKRHNIKVVKNEIVKSEKRARYCSLCGKNFKSAVWLTKHIAREHSSPQSYYCQICAKSFRKERQLRNHSTSHLKTHVCNVCGKRFGLEKQLEVHYLSHSDVRPYICDTCHMAFKMKHTLVNHLKVHENNKLYLCHICGKNLSSPTNVKNHMVVHTCVRPFACKHCNYRTGYMSSLRKHEQRHTSLRMHSCAHCQKSFYDTAALARHTRIHTGEKPYKCPHCVLGFTDSWKRKIHLMRVHQLTLEDIPRLARDGRPATQ